MFLSVQFIMVARVYKLCLCKSFFLVLLTSGMVQCFTFVFVISSSLIVNMGNIFVCAHFKELVLLLHPVIQIYCAPISLRYNQYLSS